VGEPEKPMPNPVIVSASVNLDSITATTAIVLWETDQSAMGKVTFWKQGESWDKRGIVSTGSFALRKLVQLTGLEPRTVYEFSIEVWNTELSLTKKESAGFVFKTTDWIESVEEEEEDSDFETLTEALSELLEITVNPENALSGGVPEGSIVEFSASIGELESEGLEFEWDFGGEGKESGMDVFHYYGLLDPGQNEKEFTVLVLVKKKGLLVYGREFEVKVVVSPLKVHLLKPDLFGNEKYGGIVLELELLDAVQERIKKEDVLNLEVEFSGVELDLLVEESGLIKCVVDGNVFFGLFEFVEVNAKAKTGDETFSVNSRIPLYFKPAEIFLRNPFAYKKFFINSCIKEVELMAFYPDETQAHNVELEIDVVAATRAKKIDAKLLGANLSADFSLVIGKEDLLNGVTAKVKGRDYWGNNVKEQSFVLPLGRKNPLFNIELISHNNNPIFGYGQAVDLKAKVNSIKYFALKNVKLWLVDYANNERIELDSLGDWEYGTTIEMPEFTQGVRSMLLVIEGEAEIGEQKWYDFEEIDAQLSRNTLIEFIYPVETGGVFGEQNELIARFSYLDGVELPHKKISALISLNGTTEPVVFKKHGGEFKAELTEAKLFGGRNNLLSIDLIEPLNGCKTINPFLEDPFLLVLLAAGLVLVGVLGFSLFYARKKFVEGSTKKKSFKEKKSYLEGLLKKYEYEYMKQHISEEDYRRKHIKITEKLKQLKARKKTK